MRGRNGAYIKQYSAAINSKLTELTNIKPPMTDSIKSTALKFWDKISFSEDLFRRFFFLNRAWFGFLRTVALSSGFTLEESVNENQYLYWNWIKENLKIGPEDYRAGCNTQTKLYGFYNTVKSYKKKTGKDKISPKSLAEYGYDEECYKDTLFKLSQYMAAVSGLSIPEKITEYCKKDKTPPLPPIKKEDLFWTNSRFPIIFIIDTSLSMGNSLPILQDGLMNLVGLLKNDERLRQKTDLYIITTTGEKLMDFTAIQNLNLNPDSIKLHSTLSPARITAALNTSITDLEERIVSSQNKGEYLDYCPWIIIISNGKWLKKYNEDFDRTVERVKEKAEKKVFKLYIRTLQEPTTIKEEQRDMVARLDPDFESLKNTNDFFNTVFQSLCGLKAISPSCGDGIDLPNTNGI